MTESNFLLWEVRNQDHSKRLRGDRNIGHRNKIRSPERTAISQSHEVALVMM